MAGGMSQCAIPESRHLRSLQRDGMEYNNISKLSGQPTTVIAHNPFHPDC
jgi:hypothetical protein